MSVFHQSTPKRKLLTAARQSKMALPERLPPVAWMTDPDRTHDLLAICAKLPPNWIVVYRHFGHSGRVETAADLARLCKRRRLKLLIANDPRLAKRVDADGVHWPYAAHEQAKYWRRAFRLMTVSAHSPREMRRISTDVFDAAIVSTVFASDSPSAGRPLGAQKFRRLSRTTPLPCYGLGGVGPETARSIASHAGLAMVSAIDTAFDN